MVSLKTIQKKFPGAYSIVGRVVVRYQNKHYDLGKYMGDGMVVLSKDGERLMAPPKLEVKKPEGKGKVVDAVKEVGGVDLDDLEL